MKQKYGLIGFPLGHSFSKQFFTDKFAAEGIDAEYELYPLEEIEQIRNLLKSEPNLMGLNVTIPYKKSIIPYLDELSPEAQKIGAVNTISIQHKSDRILLKGWNTDAPAFESEILKFTNGKAGKALVLGNGGAAAAAGFVLKKLGWDIRNVVRNPESGDNNPIAYSGIDKEIMEQTDLIVNTTPLGMSQLTDQIPPVPVVFFSDKHLVFDMIYNPEITRFMHAAIERGAKVSNGLGMLHLQAELAWKIWQVSSVQIK